MYLSFQEISNVTFCHSLCQSVTGITFCSYLRNIIFKRKFYIINNICLSFKNILYNHSFCIKFCLCFKYDFLCQNAELFSCLSVFCIKSLLPDFQYIFCLYDCILVSCLNLLIILLLWSLCLCFRSFEIRLY